MERNFFDRETDRRNTFCEKWDDRSVMEEGGIPLWVADMDFACAPEIMEAIRIRSEHPCFGYTSSLDYDENTEALCGFWKRRHGLEIAAESCVLLPCVITGLKTCVRVFTEPGDGVIVMTPVYGPFYASVKLNGRRMMEVPLQPDESGMYRMDFPAMEKALQNGARMIMICSPHNPVSRVWYREELERTVQLAAQYDAKIVCDEIHADFVFAPRTFIPILSVPGAEERTVMLCSASKTFNIAGLQQACAVIPNDEMRRRVQQELEAAGVTSGNIFALTATKTAYRYGDQWLDALMNYLTENRDFLTAWVGEHLPEVSVTPIEATYLAWLNCRAYGKSTEELLAACRTEGVALTGGTFFGSAGEGFLRLNFACPHKQLLEGLKRLENALTGLRKPKRDKTAGV